MSRFVRFRDVTDEDRISEWVEEDWDPTPDDIRDRMIPFVIRIFPWIRDSAQARGLPKKMVAMALRVIADSFDPPADDPLKETTEKSEKE